MDFTTLTDTELDAYRLGVAAEVTRRQNLAALPLQIEALQATYRAADGIRDGTEYRQPTGAHDAVEPGGKRVFQGRLYENTSGTYLSHSPAEYPAGWTDHGPADATTPDPTEHPEWAADVAYQAGDIIVYQGTVYTILQAHTSASRWLPPDTPSLYSAV